MPKRRQLERNRSRLSGLEVADESFSGLDLRYAVAQSSKWTNCRFENLRLSAANFGDATFDGCTFIRCRLDRSALVSRIYRTRFEACDLDEVNFRGADVRESSFLRCRAHYSDWSGATLSDSRLDLDFRNANLTFAVTRNVDFTGSSLWSASTPWNCAFFAGNTFDARQIGSALALMTYAKLPEDFAKRIEALVPTHHAALVKRLVVAES